MARELVVNTGAVKVPIKDEFGDVIGEIRFVPSDIDIVKRYEKVQEHFKNMEIPDDPTAEQIISLSDEIGEQFNVLLNADVKEGLFGKCSPLTPLADGTLYCFSVLEALNGLITEEFKNRADSARKIEEATKEYN